MRFWRSAFIPLIIAALLAWTGCGGSGNTYTPDPGPGDGQLPTGTWTGTVGTDAVSDPGFSGVPEIPFDSIQTSRAASEGDTGDPLVLYGSQFIQKYNAEVDGTSLVLAAPESAPEGDFTIAFGLYKFAGLQDKSPQWLNIECMPRMFGEEYYVGIADYTLGDWRWFGPVTFPEFQLDMRDIYHRFVTELGNMYFVVVCEAGNGATLSKSTLTVAEGGGEELLPGAPHGLVATDGAFEHKVVIEWCAGFGAEYYELWRRHDEGEWGKYAETEGTRFEDDEVVPGDLYWYKAFSVNEHGRSEHSNIDSGYAGEQGGEPTVHPPFDLVASDGLYEEKVRVEWEHEGDYSYFELWRKRDGEGYEWGKIAQTEVGEFNDVEVGPEVVYWYKARAIWEGHESEWSNHDSGYAAGGGGGERPPAPWELWASDGTHEAKVVVEWGYEGDAFFDVYRKVHEEGAEWGVIGETGERHFYDWEVEPEVIYVYKVRAWVGGVESEDSNTDTGFAAGGGGLHSPYDLIATDGLYEDKVRIEWMMEGDYGYFDLWRKRDGEQYEWGRLATTEIPEYNDFEVDAGVHYIYKVRAIIGEQESDWSNHDVGWASGGEGPPAPWELWATDGAHADKVVVSWHYAIEGAWFDVYRKLHEEGAEWTVIDETQETHYYDYEVDAEVVYVYKVVPWVEGVQGPASNTDTGFAAGGSGPAAPFDLVASDGNYEDKVRVEWMMEGDYSYFDLWRKRDGEQYEWGRLATTEAAEYNDFEVDPTVTYWYKVRAILGEQEGEWSNHDSGFACPGGGPEAPWELSATDGTHVGQVVLEWGYEGEAFFDVYRKVFEGEGDWQVIGETGNRYYHDEAVDAEVVYVYKVRAWVGGEESGDSNTDTGWAAGEGGGPNAPFELVATDGLYEHYVRIEWGHEGDYSYFEVWRKRDGEGYEWGKIGQTEAKGWSDDNVDAGVLYVYRARAILGEQESEWSNMDEGYAGDR